MTRARHFEHSLDSVTVARRFATESIRGASTDALDAVGLMVSELASNCIQHANSGCELAIFQQADEIRVEATDRGAGEPRMRSPKPTEATGRGLRSSGRRMGL